MRRGTAGMASVRSTEPRHSARAPCSRCRKPITPVRIELASALRAKQINVHVTVPWTSLQQARWASALSAPLYGAPLAGRACGMGAAADAPEPSRAAAPSGLHSRASCQWSRNRATSSLPSDLESGSNGGLAIPNLRCRNAAPQDSRAAHQLATELPLCFEALFGLGWCNNTLNLAPMVGAKQAWLPPSLATSEEAKLRFGSTARSNRSMEPAARELELRPSQRIVQALAETLRWFQRVFHCIGM